MKKHSKLLMLGGMVASVVALLTGLAATRVEAQGLYRYIDSRGVSHFTNVPPGDQRFHSVRLTPRGVEQGRNLIVRPPVFHAYDRLIARTARAYGLEPALVKAVVAAESNFDARAVSRKGAQGLMQLMPATARELGVAEPFEPGANVLGGTRYLRQMLERYGDVSRALAAYNAGPRTVDRYRGIPPYAETRAYVARVLDYRRRYERDFQRSPDPSVAPQDVLRLTQRTP